MFDKILDVHDIKINSNLSINPKIMTHLAVVPWKKLIGKKILIVSEDYLGDSFEIKVLDVSSYDEFIKVELDNKKVWLRLSILSTNYYHSVLNKKDININEIKNINKEQTQHAINYLKQLQKMTNIKNAHLRADEFLLHFFPDSIIEEWNKVKKEYC